MTPTSPTDPPLRHERDARGVHRITLAEPRSYNVLSDAMLDALLAATGRVADDAEARAVVIAAEGKAFCAGHNLREMLAHPDLSYYQALFGKCSRMMLGLLKLPVPVLARVQGIATAAGCQLVAQCDLAVAAQGVKFGVNGIDVGLFCATPSVPLVRNLGPKLAMEMLVTGEFITAEQACAQGLVNRVVAPEALDGAVESLVEAILSKPREALALGKQCFYAQREMGIEAAYQLAGQTMAHNMMQPCAQEGVLAFTEKRAPAWKP